ncbi:Serine/threonine-protein kinase [Minicystis rosea]|nr:Serine/threonine-protein kinase [Minicystis rosea]
MDDDVELQKTIEARLADDPDAARTLVKDPRATIDPGHALPEGDGALAALRALGGSLEGRITVHRTLGEGGMGVVHLATQATVGRQVAVKTLRAGAGDLDATLRILREAWVTGALEHPNVVPIYDVGVDASGSPVIVMKRIEGREWAALMHASDEIAQRFSAADPLEWNLRILGSVCNAVHFAHSRGILHRDLKPDNVMIGAFGEVYLLDWGIAVSLRDDAGGRLPLAAHESGIAGTPSYMAPEMFLGDPRGLSPRTDVYLLGAIFYEIFAGVPPHRGDSLPALMSSALLSNPSFPPSFPFEARLICQKAMSRNPASRYESAEAFRAAVEGYLQHRVSRRLAFDAKQSLTRLLHTLAHEPPGEDKTLAVFNLLGECRFGYRAALSAWKDNEAAQNGLDRALLAVVEHELTEGDAHAAAALLREVGVPPPDLAARVEEAARARAENDERLRRLEVDLDPSVGTRTRTFIGAIFGVTWTVMPLAAWAHVASGGKVTHRSIVLASSSLLAFCLLLCVWARESKTLLNRRIALTLSLHLAGQLVLGAGAWLLGLTPEQSESLHILSWGVTETMLAVWVEPWFAAPALVCAISFLVAAAAPRLLYGAMAVDNVVFTLVLVRVWFPRADIVKIQERRNELRRRALRWLRDERVASSPGAGEAFDEEQV